MSTAIYRAKVFRTGGSLAVRLPKACRVAQEGEEVLLHREGDRIVIEPDRWSADFLACLGSVTEDIPVRPRNRKRSGMRVYL